MTRTGAARWGRENVSMGPAGQPPGMGRETNPDERERWPLPWRRAPPAGRPNGQLKKRRVALCCACAPCPHTLAAQSSPAPEKKIVVAPGPVQDLVRGIIRPADVDGRCSLPRVLFSFTGRLDDGLISCLTICYYILCSLGGR
jgi:hypothetical protein